MSNVKLQGREGSQILLNITKCCWNMRRIKVLQPLNVFGNKMWAQRLMNVMKYRVDEGLVLQRGHAPKSINCGWWFTDDYIYEPRSVTSVFCPKVYILGGTVCFSAIIEKTGPRWSDGELFSGAALMNRVQKSWIYFHVVASVLYCFFFSYSLYV